MYLSEEVQNLNESYVEDEFRRLGFFDQYDNDQVQDLFCLVLNRLPPRYVRHAVDAQMNMTSADRLELGRRVDAVIREVRPMLDRDRRKTPHG